MHDLTRAFSPLFALLYTGFLITIVAVAVIRAGRLSYRLFGGARQHRVSLDGLLDSSVSTDDLARGPLVSLASPEAMSPERLARLRAGPRAEADATLRRLRAADARFAYLWRRQAIVVSSTWNLMRLTLIVAAFVTAYGFYPTWEYATFGDNNSPDSLVLTLRRAGNWIRFRLAMGLAVAGLLCVVAMVFDAVLQRRLASWKYFYATARDALSDARP